MCAEGGQSNLTLPRPCIPTAATQLHTVLIRPALVWSLKSSRYAGRARCKWHPKGHAGRPMPLVDGTGLGELIWSLPNPPRCWLVLVPESNYTKPLSG